MGNETSLCKLARRCLSRLSCLALSAAPWSRLSRSHDPNPCPPRLPKIVHVRRQSGARSLMSGPGVEPERDGDVGASGPGASTERLVGARVPRHRPQSARAGASTRTSAGGSCRRTHVVVRRRRRPGGSPPGHRDHPRARRRARREPPRHAQPSPPGGRSRGRGRRSDEALRAPSARPRVDHARRRRTAQRVTPVRRGRSRRRRPRSSARRTSGAGRSRRSSPPIEPVATPSRRLVRRRARQPATCG